jgi:hypothetical protein
MKRLLALLFLLLPLQFAAAGSACQPSRTDALTFSKAMTLAENTRAALEASGAQVALVARIGQDLSKYGQRYSHMAWAWREQATGRWLVMHELNTCGTARSGLFDEGLGNFFLDDMFIYESRILIPGPAYQERIGAMLASRAPSRLHNPEYNMLAYAFSTRYQNSNQWVLETYAAASSEMFIGQREQAQAWLKLAGYRPITVYVPATTRLGARMFSANIAFDDHPFGRRMEGQIDTVTVESVLRFVRERDGAAREAVVTLR